MQDMIRDRRNAEKKEEGDDLFSNLLDASEAETDTVLKLTDTELMGKR
jgi:cytochrome P450